MTGEWCGPTGQLSAHKLASLVDRTRRCTGRQKKPTDSSAPLNDPWFDDSGVVQVPELDPSKPIEIENPNERARKERTGIPKVVVAPKYPVYRSTTNSIVRWMIGLSVIGAAVATIGFTL